MGNDVEATGDSTSSIGLFVERLEDTTVTNSIDDTVQFQCLVERKFDG